MTPELQKYYEDYEDLFFRDGWKTLKEELQGQLEIISDVSAVTSAEDLWYRKGQIQVLNYIINLEAFMEQGKQNAEESDLDDYDIS